MTIISILTKADCIYYVYISLYYTIKLLTISNMVN